MEYLIASLVAASTVNVSSLGPGLWNFDLLVSSFHCPAQGSAAAFLSWANARDHPSKSPNRTSFFVMISLPLQIFDCEIHSTLVARRARCQDCRIEHFGAYGRQHIDCGFAKENIATKIAFIRRVRDPKKCERRHSRAQWLKRRIMSC